MHEHPPSAVGSGHHLESVSDGVASAQREAISSRDVRRRPIGWIWRVKVGVRRYTRCEASSHWLDLASQGQSEAVPVGH